MRNLLLTIALFATFILVGEMRLALIFIRDNPDLSNDQYTNVVLYLAFIWTTLAWGMYAIVKRLED